MRRLTIEEVHAQKIRELGLDPEALDLTTPEGLAGALRRAASYLCPCSATTLVRAVVRPLRGLVPDLEKAKELAEETLEAMVSHGDILEQPEVEDRTSTARVLLYAAPASFVVRQSGLVILLGVTADQLSPLPSELERRIEYLGHVRRLSPSQKSEHLRVELHQLGLFELSSDTWLKGPKIRSASQILAEINHSLDTVPPSRDIPGLLLLDPEVCPVLPRALDRAESTNRAIRRAATASLWRRSLVLCPFNERPPRADDRPPTTGEPMARLRRGVAPPDGDRCAARRPAALPYHPQWRRCSSRILLASACVGAATVGCDWGARPERRMSFRLPNTQDRDR